MNRKSRQLSGNRAEKKKRKRKRSILSVFIWFPYLICFFFFFVSLSMAVIREDIEQLHHSMSSLRYTREMKNKAQDKSNPAVINISLAEWTCARLRFHIITIHLSLWTLNALDAWVFEHSIPSCVCQTITPKDETFLSLSRSINATEEWNMSCFFARRHSSSSSSIDVILI